MVSYYNPMYRHQQPNGQFQHQPNNHMSAWYASGYHNGAQMGAAPPASYLPQEEPQMWHHHGPGHHGVFQPHDFPDFVHTGIPPLQPHAADPENQLPSPPITVSGSEMSSPGGGQSGNISPAQMVNNPRPPPARSPYEWIKKTSYQTQPNPGKTRTKDKYRVVYTDHQRIELEKEFTFVNKYITIRRKSELAATLGLSERQVKIWFQNRRAKERKQNKKRVEEKTQIDMYNHVNIQAPGILNQHQPTQNGVMNHQQQQQQHQSQMEQSVLPTIVPPPNAIMQRFLQDQQVMKLESSEHNDQIG